MVRLRSGVKTRESDPQLNELSSAKKSEGDARPKRKRLAVNSESEKEKQADLIENTGQKSATENDETKITNHNIENAADPVSASDEERNHQDKRTKGKDVVGRSVIAHRLPVDVKPEGIESIAGNGSVLAFGRSSGCIEVGIRQGPNVHPNFTVPGTRSQGLKCLVWQTNRLFGGCLDGSVFEVDLRLRAQKREEPCGGGGVWDMDSNGTYIAAACEDGNVRLFVPREEDCGLVPHRTLSGSSNSRLLSIKFHGSHADEFVFTGGMDAYIRKWSLKQRRVVDVISVPTLSRSIAIWTIDTCASMVACGDSLGRVHVWSELELDAPQTFSEHRADILAVKFNSDGTSLFASGVDPRVAAFRFVQGKWVYAYSHRAHTHDVRSLASIDKGPEELICSGGIDAQLITYPVATFEKARPRKNSPYSQRQCVAVGTLDANDDNRVLLVMHPFKLDVWTLSVHSRSQRYLASIEFDEDVEIRCADMSKDCTFIAVADDVRALSVFKLDWDESAHVSAQNEIVPSVERIPIDGLPGNDAIRSLAFAGSQKLLVVGTIDQTLLVDLENCVVSKSLATTGPVVGLSASWDGQWLAMVTANSSLAQESVEVFNLDTMRSIGALPGTYFEGAHSALGFSSNSTDIVVARAGGLVYGFRVDDGLRESWRVSITPLFQEKIIGITFNPAEEGTLAVWSWSTILTIPRKSGPIENRLLRKFKPLIYAGFLKPDEILILEAPFVQALKHLPDVVEREKFGS